jgi:hypothetical protein
MGKLSMELYLNTLVERYAIADKREKGEILDELCSASGYHKKPGFLEADTVAHCGTSLAGSFV